MQLLQRKAAAVDPDDETTKKEAKPAKSAKKAETPSNPEWTVCIPHAISLTSSNTGIFFTPPTQNLTCSNPQLSSNSRGSRKVSVETWNNSILVSIREFYDDNGTLKPGKKGTGSQCCPREQHEFQFTILL